MKPTLSNNTNSLLYDSAGLPSLMVQIPLFFMNEISSEFEHIPHPMFLTPKGTAPYVYISKYQNVVINGRAYSLAGQSAKNFISYDEALACCREKGPGWHLMTNFEWAGLALWSLKNHTLPRGNNASGADCTHPEEAGTPIPLIPGEHPGRVLTGSGPAAWSHDHTPGGVFDCNGNLAEWVGGLRMENGKLLWLIPKEAANSNSQRRESPDWRALLADGSFVSPDTAHALHFDYTCPPPAAGGTPDFALTDCCVYPQKPYEHPQPGIDQTYGHQPFSDFSCRVPLSQGALRLLKASCVLPFSKDCTPGDLYFRNDQESAALRGGHWYHGHSAGMFWLNLAHEPAYRAERIGFRCAFVDPKYC